MNQAYGGQSAQQGHQSKKTDLAIGESGNPVKGLTPLPWKKERHYAFQYQHQGERKYPWIFHRTPASLFGGATATRSGTLEVPEEFRAGIEHHHVMIVLEAGAIRFQTAVKLVELRILAKCLGIDA